jgi:hypothetical protein
MFTILIEFINKSNWHYSKPFEDKTIIQLGFEGRNGKFQCICDVKEDSNKFLCYTIGNNKVPVEKLLSVCEYITRVNSTTMLGNFELNFEQGEIRYKTSIDYEGITPTATLIEHLLLANITTYDNFLPGIMKVIFSDIQPKQAFEETISKNAYQNEAPS